LDSGGRAGHWAIDEPGTPVSLALNSSNAAKAGRSVIAPPLGMIDRGRHAMSTATHHHQLSAYTLAGSPKPCRM
jgi:hypothetical protein